VNDVVKTYGQENIKNQQFNFDVYMDR